MGLAGAELLLLVETGPKGKGFLVPRVMPQNVGQIGKGGSSISVGQLDKG